MVNIQDSKLLNKIAFFDFIIITFFWIFFNILIVGVIFGLTDLADDLVSKTPIVALFILVSLLAFRDQVKSIL